MNNFERVRVYSMPVYSKHGGKIISELITLYVEKLSKTLSIIWDNMKWKYKPLKLGVKEGNVQLRWAFKVPVFSKTVKGYISIRVSLR